MLTPHISCTACIKRHVSRYIICHLCGAGPVCLLTPCTAPPRCSSAATVCCCVHVALTDDVSGGMLLFLWTELHSSGLHGAPSCAICLVCLHSGLANTSLHHIYIGGRKVRHESLHNFPITPLLSSADNPTPEIRTSLVTC